jgi:hypothetical protein
MNLESIKREHEEEFSKCQLALDRNSFIYKQVLFSDELNNLHNIHKCNKDKKEIDEFTLQLIKIVIGLKFFITDDIKAKLIELGLKENSIKKMVSINQIKIEIDSANQSELIYINPYFAIGFISNYLDFCLVNSIQTDLDYTTTHTGNQITTINSTAALFHSIVPS